MDFNINIGGQAPSQPASQYQAINQQNVQQSKLQTVDPSPVSPQQNQQTSEQVDFTNFLQHANNPFIVFFTLLFKVLAAVFFLVLKIFKVSDALIFILVVILSAFDFWFVKNVSGRILVGLRWWNEVKEDGSEVWIFESDHERRSGSIDSTIFWGSIYITPLFWGVFMIIEIISLDLMWFLVCLIAFVLTFSNTLVYYKCSGEQKKKLTNFIADKGQAGFAKLINYGASAVAGNSQQTGTNPQV